MRRKRACPRRLGQRPHEVLEPGRLHAHQEARLRRRHHVGMRDAARPVHEGAGGMLRCDARRPRAPARPPGCRTTRPRGYAGAMANRSPWAPGAQSWRSAPPVAAPPALMVTRRAEEPQRLTLTPAPRRDRLGLGPAADLHRFFPAGPNGYCDARAGQIYIPTARQGDAGSATACLRCKRTVPRPCLQPQAKARCCGNDAHRRCCFPFPAAAFVLSLRCGMADSTPSGHGAPPAHVQENPDRQSRRDRLPHHQDARASSASRRWRSTRRPTATACTSRWPTRPSPSARRRPRSPTS